MSKTELLYLFLIYLVLFSQKYLSLKIYTRTYIYMRETKFVHSFNSLSSVFSKNLTFHDKDDGGGSGDNGN